MFRRGDACVDDQRRQTPRKRNPWGSGAFQSPSKQHKHDGGVGPAARQDTGVLQTDCHEEYTPFCKDQRRTGSATCDSVMARGIDSAPRQQRTAPHSISKRELASSSFADPARSVRRNSKPKHDLVIDTRSPATHSQGPSVPQVRNEPDPADCSKHQKPEDTSACNDGLPIIHPYTHPWQQQPLNAPEDDRMFTILLIYKLLRLHTHRAEYGTGLGNPRIMADKFPWRARDYANALRRVRQPLNRLSHRIYGFPTPQLDMCMWLCSTSGSDTSSHSLFKPESYSKVFDSLWIHKNNTQTYLDFKKGSRHYKQYNNLLQRNRRQKAMIKDRLREAVNTNAKAFKGCFDNIHSMMSYSKHTHVCHLSINPMYNQPAALPIAESSYALYWQTFKLLSTLSEVQKRCSEMTKVRVRTLGQITDRPDFVLDTSCAPPSGVKEGIKTASWYPFQMARLFIDGPHCLVQLFLLIQGIADCLERQTMVSELFTLMRGVLWHPTEASEVLDLPLQHALLHFVSKWDKISSIYTECNCQLQTNCQRATKQEQHSQKYLQMQYALQDSKMDALMDVYWAQQSGAVTQDETSVLRKSTQAKVKNTLCRVNSAAEEFKFVLEFPSDRIAQTMSGAYKKLKSDICLVGKCPASASKDQLIQIGASNMSPMQSKYVYLILASMLLTNDTQQDSCETMLVQPSEYTIPDLYLPKSEKSEKIYFRLSDLDSERKAEQRVTNALQTPEETCFSPNEMPDQQRGIWSFASLIVQRSNSVHSLNQGITDYEALAVDHPMPSLSAFGALSDQHQLHCAVQSCAHVTKLEELPEIEDALLPLHERIYTADLLPPEAAFCFKRNFECIRYELNSRLSSRKLVLNLDRNVMKDSFGFETIEAKVGKLSSNLKDHKAEELARLTSLSQNEFNKEWWQKLHNKEKATFDFLVRSVREKCLQEGATLILTTSLTNNQLGTKSIDPDSGQDVTLKSRIQRLFKEDCPVFGGYTDTSSWCYVLTPPVWIHAICFEPVLLQAANPYYCKLTVEVYNETDFEKLNSKNYIATMQNNHFQPAALHKLLRWQTLQFVNENKKQRLPMSLKPSLCAPWKVQGLWRIHNEIEIDIINPNGKMETKLVDQEGKCYHPFTGQVNLKKTVYQYLHSTGMWEVEHIPVFLALMHPLRGNTSQIANVLTVLARETLDCIMTNVYRNKAHYEKFQEKLRKNCIKEHTSTLAALVRDSTDLTTIRYIAYVLCQMQAAMAGAFYAKDETMIKFLACIQWSCHHELVDIRPITDRFIRDNISEAEETPDFLKEAQRLEMHINRSFLSKLALHDNKSAAGLLSALQKLTQVCMQQRETMPDPAALIRKLDVGITETYFDAPSPRCNGDVEFQVKAQCMQQDRETKLKGLEASLMKAKDVNDLCSYTWFTVICQIQIHCYEPLKKNHVSGIILMMYWHTELQLMELLTAVSKIEPSNYHVLEGTSQHMQVISNADLQWSRPHRLAKDIGWSGCSTPANLTAQVKAQLEAALKMTKDKFSERFFRNAPVGSIYYKIGQEMIDYFKNE